MLNCVLKQFAKLIQGEGFHLVVMLIVLKSLGLVSQCQHFFMTNGYFELLLDSPSVLALYVISDLYVKLMFYYKHI